MGVHKIPAPPRGELERLYLKDRENIKDLAPRYSVSVPTMGRWLREYGLKRTRVAKKWPRVRCPNCDEEFQSSKDRKVYCSINCARSHKASMMNLARRVPKPPRERLEGRMVADIRSEFNVCAGTVYAWLESYGLHAPRPTLEIPPREVLEGKSQRSLEKELGVSRPTIRKWQKHYGIEPLPSGRKTGAKDKKPRKATPKPRVRKVKPLPPVERKPAPVKTKCVIPERPAPRDKTQEDKERKMVEDWLRDHPRV